jgi:hypothetical protein
MTLEQLPATTFCVAQATPKNLGLVHLDHSSDLGAVYDGLLAQEYRQIV